MPFIEDPTSGNPLGTFDWHPLGFLGISCLTQKSYQIKDENGKLKRIRAEKGQIFYNFILALAFRPVMKTIVEEYGSLTVLDLEKDDFIFAGFKEYISGPNRTSISRMETNANSKLPSDFHDFLQFLIRKMGHSIGASKVEYFLSYKHPEYVQIRIMGNKTPVIFPYEFIKLLFTQPKQKLPPGPRARVLGVIGKHST